GSIVNVTSIEGFRAAPMFAVYAACKAGMVSFTQSMALELSDQNIRVNCIAPDQTITPGLRGNRDGPVEPSTWPERKEVGPRGTLRAIPLRREGVVEDCASTVVFLCSPMSGYITGETFHVDGGTYAAGGWIGNPSEGWTASG
ncbi:MAG TPA: SDR family oxidoreductase, partial [Acidimicrobiia bacterium]